MDCNLQNMNAQSRDVLVNGGLQVFLEDLT